MVVPQTLKNLQWEYVTWCKTLPEGDNFEQKMNWWFAKAKQQAVRIAELEEKLNSKKGGSLD